MNDAEKINTLNEIFFQNNRERISVLINEGTRFAYYTTAENAFKIIDSQKLWMRNILTMNDFSEFEHGRQCLIEAMKSEAGVQMIQLLDQINDFNACSKAYESFNIWTELIRGNTCITCFSEHDNSEDQTGRLSMWRAYGGKNGVALIFKSMPFLDVYRTHRISTSSVVYYDHGKISIEIEKIVNSVKANISFLKSLDPALIYTYLYNVFKYASLCNKHPGFKEEREWRLILSDTEQPQMAPQVSLDAEIIRGVPQLVFKLPLENIGLANLSIDNVLDRIIIGPCEFPYNTARAFTHLLSKINVVDFDKKVIVSNIPLRHHS